MKPNHFLTVGLCSRDYARLEHDEFPDLAPLIGTNLCALLKPLPDALANIVAGAVPVRYRHKTTGEWFPNCNSPFSDNYERVILSTAEIAELEAEYGAANWFDWQKKNWGTKWGTYDTKIHELGSDGQLILIEFQSAWGPPSDCMLKLITEYLRREYCLKDIHWLGHNPYDDSVVDL